MKNTSIPSLSGMYINGETAIVSNMEITLEMQLGCSAESPILIPLRAFDMIKSLPEGILDIQQDEKFQVTIKSEKQRVRFAGFDPRTFDRQKNIPEGESVTLPGEKLMEAFEKVVFAADDTGANPILRGVNICTHDGVMQVTATDGHVVATDQVEAKGIQNIDVIIPKATVKKLISMNMDDDVTFFYDKTSAVFKTPEYTIYSRLIDGKYIDINRFFAEGDNAIEYGVNRKDFQDAVFRANLCLLEEKKPLVAQLGEKTIDLTLSSSTTGYAERLDAATYTPLDIRIGLNTKIILEALKGFTDDHISLKIIGKNAPIYISAKSTPLKMMVLPVVI